MRVIMSNRLKNRKADIRYIKGIIDRLPDGFTKSSELARILFIEKGIVKNKSFLGITPFKYSSLITANLSSAISSANCSKDNDILVV